MRIIWLPSDKVVLLDILTAPPAGTTCLLVYLWERQLRAGNCELWVCTECIMCWHTTQPNFSSSLLFGNCPENICIYLWGKKNSKWGRCCTKQGVHSETGLYNGHATFRRWFFTCVWPYGPWLCCVMSTVAPRLLAEWLALIMVVMNRRPFLVLSPVPTTDFTRCETFTMVNLSDADVCWSNSPPLVVVTVQT